jgi:hypothetical protein
VSSTFCEKKHDLTSLHETLCTTPTSYRHGLTPTHEMSCVAHQMRSRGGRDVSYCCWPRKLHGQISECDLEVEGASHIVVGLGSFERNMPERQ